MHRKDHFIVCGHSILAINTILQLNQRGQNVTVKRRTKNAKAFHDKCENKDLRVTLMLSPVTVMTVQY